MKHPIAIGSWAFIFGPFQNRPWELSRVLEWTRDSGYDGIELSGFAPHPHHDVYDSSGKCRELVREIEEYGLRIAGYAPDLASVPPGEAAAETYLAEIRKCLAFSERCGINLMRVDTVSPPDALTEHAYRDRFARLAGVWRQSAKEAEQSGVRLVWEFEPGFWLNKPSEVERLIEAVDHPNFKILFDPSHAYMSGVIGARQTGAKEVLAGGVTEYASRLSPHIGHLHLIDSDGTLHHDETSTHTPFGAGHVDFRELFRAIRTVVEQLPWWGVDFCFHADVEQDGKAAVPFIRQLEKEVL